jgi:BASS family bile acid:Na+ symporter
VTLTGLSCLFAGATIPLIGRIFELVLPQPLELMPPISVLAVQLLLTLALPVGLGMWIRQVRADLARRYQGTMQRLSFVGVALVLILVVLDNPQAFFDGLRSTVPLAAIFVVSCAIVGWVAAATVTTDPRNRFTLAAEFGTRNLGWPWPSRSHSWDASSSPASRIRTFWWNSR